MKVSSLKSDLTAILILGGTILLAVLSFNSCKDDTDDTPPSITLNEEQLKNLYLQSTWTDPGAVAIDNKDGVVNVTTSGTFDVNKTGTYYITYTATDAAGNAASTTRTIVVSNELTSSSWTGDYTCSKDSAGTTLYTYSDTLMISSTLNNQLAFGKFGDLQGADKLFNFEIDDLGAVIPFVQTITSGSPAVAITYDGAGTTVTGSTSQIIFTISETSPSGTNNYTYTMTKN